MKIVSVIPLKKGILKGDLTYFSGFPIEVGHVVSVPIRNKKSLALVTKVEEVKNAKSDIRGMDFNLRKVAEDKGPSVFLKEFLNAAFSTGKYFAENNNNVLMSVIPNIFLEHYDKISKVKTAEEKNIVSNNLRSEKLLLQYPFLDRLSVYKTLVRESFARSKSVFLVLPTEYDIEKWSMELSRGIEPFTFSLYGKATAKKNLGIYENILTSTHPVLIIATAPYLSIPRKDIGTIILEHENSNAYRMIARPHLDLRIFTEIYASRIGAKFILGDEILRFETLGRKEIDNFHPLHPLSYRLEFPGKILVLEKEKRETGEKFRIFDQESLDHMDTTLSNNKNVFVFSLRKGLATMTVCRDCGDTVTCKDCSAPLVLYLSHKGKERMFVCNRCEKEMDGETLCKSCGGWNLMPLGIGTDTVYEEIKRNFPKAKIFKLDKESAKTSKGAREIVQEFEENQGAVLIGTEMAFFYLKNKVSLSVVASFDSLWSIPNFKMSEKVIQIIISIINLTAHKLIIETKNVRDKAILSIKAGNLLSFIREELEDRERLNYPPYKRFIKITFFGDKEQTVKARKALQEIFTDYSPIIFSGFVARLKGKYVTNALIKMDLPRWSLPELSLNSKINEDLLYRLLALPITFEVQVDPEDLL